MHINVQVFVLRNQWIIIKVYLQMFVPIDIIMSISICMRLTGICGNRYIGI